MRALVFLLLFAAAVSPAQAHARHMGQRQASLACLKPQARAALGQLVRRIGPVLVTSTCGGRHVRGSMHYRGLAFDFKPVNANHSRAVAALRTIRGIGGIGTYPTHVHADVGARQFAWHVGGYRRHASRHRYSRFASYRPHYGYRAASYWR